MRRANITKKEEIRVDKEIKDHIFNILEKP